MRLVSIIHEDEGEEVDVNLVPEHTVLRHRKPEGLQEFYTFHTSCPYKRQDKTKYFTGTREYSIIWAHVQERHRGCNTSEDFQKTG